MDLKNEFIILLYKNHYYKSALQTARFFTLIPHHILAVRGATSKVLKHLYIFYIINSINFIYNLSHLYPVNKYLLNILVLKPKII